MIWSRSKVEVKGQGTLRRVLVARFADLPGQNTFPGFEIFPVARLSEFPGFVVFPGSIFPVVSRFLASGQFMQMLLLTFAGYKATLAQDDCKNRNLRSRKFLNSDVQTVTIY